MKEQIGKLEEAIAGTPKPFAAPGKVSGKEPGDDESLEEGVTQQVIVRLIDAMVEAPKAQALLERVAGSGAIDAVKGLVKGHLRHSIPLALADAGIDVQSAITGKAKRGIKMIAKGKGIGEVIAVWDEPISEDDEELEQTLRGILGEGVE